MPNMERISTIIVTPRVRPGTVSGVVNNHTKVFFLTLFLLGIHITFIRIITNNHHKKPRHSLVALTIAQLHIPLRSERNSYLIVSSIFLVHLFVLDQSSNTFPRRESTLRDPRIPTLLRLGRTSKKTTPVIDDPVFRDVPLQGLRLTVVKTFFVALPLGNHAGRYERYA